VTFAVPTMVVSAGSRSSSFFMFGSPVRSLDHLGILWDKEVLLLLIELLE